MEAEELKGHLDALILAILADGPNHGYAIIEQLKERSNGHLQLPEGTIYPALHRLESDGLLNSHWSTDSGRRRRVYRLTDRGTRELGDRRVRWRRFAATIDSVLAV